MGMSRATLEAEASGFAVYTSRTMSDNSRQLSLVQPTNTLAWFGGTLFSLLPHTMLHVVVALDMAFVWVEAKSKSRRRCTDVLAIPCPYI